MKPLTICIGAICNEKKKAIIIGDRMVTDDDLSIEFEHQESKIVPLSKNCAVATSGSAVFFYEILEPIIGDNKDKTPKISELAEKIAKSYSDVRKKKIEETNLRPLGFTIDNFHECQNERILEIMGRAIDEFEFPGGLEILIIGVDERGAHIYLVDNPGLSIPLDPIGWGSIGTGYPHAEYTFIANKYHTKLPFNQALYLSYEAKRRAEVAPGVGKDTDIYYVDETGVHQVSDNGIEQLKNILDEKENSIRPKEQEILEKVMKLSLW